MDREDGPPMGRGVMTMKVTLTNVETVEIGDEIIDRTDEANAER